MSEAGAVPGNARFAWRPALVLAMLAVLVGACAARAAAVVPPTAPQVDTRCSSDADCVVKDVRNCCGYYPACVNRDSKVFPEHVKAECARKNMLGVCGFAQIDGCTCSAGHCTDQTGPVGR